MKTLLILLAMSAASDGYSTQRALDRGAIESNPLLGHRPSIARIALTEGALTAGAGIALHFLHKSHPKVADGLAIEGIGLHTYATIHNTQQGAK